MEVKDILEVAISLAGVVSTVAIAWMVGRQGSRQHQENRIFGNLEIAIHRQEFRLALLDRRADIIKRVDQAVGHWQAHADINFEQLHVIDTAAYKARLLFADDVLVALKHLTNELWRGRALESEARRPRSEKRRIELIDLQIAAFDRIRSASEAARTLMDERTKIDAGLDHKAEDLLALTEHPRDAVLDNLATKLRTG